MNGVLRFARVEVQSLHASYIERRTSSFRECLQQKIIGECNQTKFCDILQYKTTGWSPHCVGNLSKPFIHNCFRPSTFCCMVTWTLYCTVLCNIYDMLHYANNTRHYKCPSSTDLMALETTAVFYIYQTVLSSDHYQEGLWNKIKVVLSSLRQGLQTIISVLELTSSNSL